MDRNPYLPKPARIVDVTVESDTGELKTFLFDFVVRGDAEQFAYLPGQFAEISILGVGEAPFGMASSPTEGPILKFTVQKTGTVTAALHALSDGDIVGIRGPLGKPFPMDRLHNRSLVLIGGGFGITTLRSLLVYAVHPGNRDLFGDITLIYGARNPGLLLFRSELESLHDKQNVKVHLAIDTEQSHWTEHVGFIPSVVETVAPASANSIAIICGPPVMIEKTVPVLEQLGFDQQDILLSLERKMKCGIGLCGRCNIGHLYVCKDGPVFSMADLQLLPQET